MSIEANLPEMKQIMKQYFLLLNRSNESDPKALLVDGSRNPTGDSPFKVLRGIDMVSYIRTKQENDAMLDFQDWYVNAWRNIMTLHSGLIDIHSCGNIIPNSIAKSLGNVSFYWWQLYLQDLYLHGRADPSSPPSGMIWYNNIEGKFKCSEAGVIKEVVTK